MLEVKGAQEEVREHARGQQRPGGAGAGEAAQAKDAQRQDRVFDAGLERKEASQQRHRGAAETEGVRRQPALIGRGHDRVDADHHRRGDQHGAQHVDTLPQAQPLLLLDQPPAEKERRDADRKIDEEDPVPVDGFGQHPAGQQTQRAPAGDHEREHAHGLGALFGPGEAGDQQRDDDAGRKRAAHPLQRAGRDKGDRVLSQPAEHGRHREHHHAGEEHLLAPDQVPGAAGQQEQAAVGDQVGVDDPGQVGLAEVQVPLDRRQRHVHDR